MFTELDDEDEPIDTDFRLKSSDMQMLCFRIPGKKCLYDIQDNKVAMFARPDQPHNGFSKERKS